MPPRFSLFGLPPNNMTVKKPFGSNVLKEVGGG
jgi:hypothetical protein